eukprot:1959625-Pyramimonas_sp.AAC.1
MRNRRPPDCLRTASRRPLEIVSDLWMKPLPAPAQVEALEAQAAAARAEAEAKAKAAAGQLERQTREGEALATKLAEQ